MKMSSLRDRITGLLIVIFILVLTVIKLDQVRIVYPTDNPKSEVHGHLREHKIIQTSLQKQTILHQADNNVTDVNTTVDVHSVFPENCVCQSMFTVGGCDIKQDIHLQKDPVQSSALSGLSTARREGTHMFKLMEILARSLPQLFTADFKINNNGVLGISLDENPSRARQSLPFLPCQMHIYTPSDVKICTESFRRKWNVPLRIAFVGDSRNRNTMQEIIRILIKELNLYIEGEDIHQPISHFTDTKAKFNVPVKGDNIEISFIWAPILDKKSDKPASGYDGLGYGAKDVFESWSEGKSWTSPKTKQIYPVPHLVVVNTGMWHTTNTPTDDAVSDFIYTMHIMTPILNKLSLITRILWPLAGPVKEYLAYFPAYSRKLSTPALDMMNSVAWLKLQNSKLWLWDTRTIMMLRQKQECSDFYEAGLQKKIPIGWRCPDFQHAGRDVEKGSLNMLWNLVCNSLLDTKNGYCCS